MFARPEIFGGVPPRRLGAQAGLAAKRLGCLRTQNISTRARPPRSRPV